MSVITEKDIISNIEDISVAERVKNKLFEKQAVFCENVFPKYSFKEKACYMNNNNINNENALTFISFFTGILTFACGTSINLVSNNFFYAFLCFFVGVFVSLSFTFTYFQRMTARIWLSKEKNNKFLSNEMFWNSNVDKETMKYMVQCCGKKHFVNLMKGKENLKYKDVFSYVQKIDSENDETKKLSKVAECLLKDEGR